MPISQDNRTLVLATPLPYNELVIQRLRATESISQLFQIELEILKESTMAETPVLKDAKKLIGQPMTVTATQDEDGTKIVRHFNGICVSFAQGGRDERYLRYRAILAPRVWLLTKKQQSRIFQQTSVPDILKKVLQGFDVKWELQGTFEQRNYCVQYRESDWNFAARLMEEEGIYFYFVHAENGHQMVVANTPLSHADAVKKRIPYRRNIGGVSETWQGSVSNWTLDDRLHAGKYTLWDHHFELVGKKLEAQEVSRFKIGGNDRLEIYDYPGEYAQRFDGVSKGGGEQSSEIQKIFNDNKRTVKIRQAELDATHKNAYGSADSCAFVPGYKFELYNHHYSPYNGQYVMVSARTDAIQSPDYVSGDDVADNYTLSFTALRNDGEDGAPFRPPRITKKPVVHGTQTAVVVGPPGEEIFTDKYGRVKVQFHWDREGQNNESSSCWMRVAQNWAGKKWGTMFIPRIGMDVLVDFLEGDPDRPIILGSLYNAENMPPYKLPDEKTKSTIKTNSSKGGGGFNEIRFEDKKGSEQIFIHAELDHETRIKRDQKGIIQRDKHLIIERDHFEQVKKDKHLGVKGDQTEKVDGNVHLKVGSNKEQKIGSKFAVDAGQEIHLKAGMSVTIEAGTQVTLKAGGNFVNIGPSGVSIKGTMVMINSGGAAGSGGGASPNSPKDPEEADKAEAGEVTKTPAPPPPLQPKQFKELAELVRQKATNPSVPNVAVAMATAAADAAQQLANKGQDIANNLQAEALGMAAAAKAAAQDKFDEVKSKVDEIADKVKSKVDEAKALADDLKDKAEGLIDQALAAAKEAKEKAEAMADKAKKVVEDAKAAAEKMVTEAMLAVDDVKEQVQEKVNEAKEAVQEAKQQVEQAAAAAKEQAEQALEQAEQALAEAQVQAQQAVAEAQQAVQQAQQEAKQAVQQAQQQVEQAAQQAQQQVEQAAQQVQQQAEQVQQQAQQAVQEVQQQAEQAIDQAQQQVEQAADQVQQAAEGAQQAAEKAGEQAQQAAQQVSEGVQNALTSAQDAIPFG